MGGLILRDDQPGLTLRDETAFAALIVMMNDIEPFSPLSPAMRAGSVVPAPSTLMLRRRGYADLLASR